MDPVVLAVLAVADMLLLIHFRRRQARRYRTTRMRNALTLAVRRSNDPKAEFV